MIPRIRSFIFDCYFYSYSTIFFILFYIPMLIVPRGFTEFFFRTWTRSTLAPLKWIVGLDFQILGKEHLDAAISNGPCLIAVKHQSAFETIVCSLLAKKFVIVLKRQLLYIPVYRDYLKKLNSIVIDREDAVSSLRSLVTHSKEAINKGFSILIFPEGTRQIPGENLPYKGGVGLLYRSLNVPVVPIALNTGVFWGRKSAYKRPGLITLQVMPAIPPGLDRNEFIERLQNTINQESDRLYQSATESMPKPDTIQESTQKKKPFSKWAIRFMGLLTVILCICIPSVQFFKHEIRDTLEMNGMHIRNVRFHFGLTSLPYFDLKKAELSIADGYTLSTPNPVQIIPTGVHRFTLVAKDVVLNKTVSQSTEILAIEKLVVLATFSPTGAMHLSRVEGMGVTLKIPNKAQETLDVLKLPMFIGHIQTKNNIRHYTLSTPYTKAQSITGDKTAPILHVNAKQSLTATPANPSENSDFSIGVESTILPELLEMLLGHTIITAEQHGFFLQGITPINYAERSDVASLSMGFTNHP